MPDVDCYGTPVWDGDEWNGYGVFRELHTVDGEEDWYWVAVRFGTPDFVIGHYATKSDAKDACEERYFR